MLQSCTTNRAGLFGSGFLGRVYKGSEAVVVVVVFFYCRAKANKQIANSANIRRHDLAQREEAKDQNKNVA